MQHILDIGTLGSIQPRNHDFREFSIIMDLISLGATDPLNR